MFKFRSKLYSKLRFIEMCFGSYYSLTLYPGKRYKRRPSGRHWFPRYPNKYLSRLKGTFPFQCYNTWQNRFLPKYWYEEYYPSQMM